MILTCNNVVPGIKRPFRISDLQQIWTALNETLASGATRIVSGFEYDDSMAAYGKGVIASGGKLYLYDPEATGDFIFEGETLKLYGGSEPTIGDKRLFGNGLEYPFYFAHYVYTQESDSYVEIADLEVTSIDDLKMPFIPAGGIVNIMIRNGSIDKSKLANNAVSTSELANNAVTTGKIVDGAVTESKIEDNSVTSEKIADDSVVNSKIADKAVDIRTCADTIYGWVPTQGATDVEVTATMATLANPLSIGELLNVGADTGMSIPNLHIVARPNSGNKHVYIRLDGISEQLIPAPTILFHQIRMVADVDGVNVIYLSSKQGVDTDFMLGTLSNHQVLSVSYGKYRKVISAGTRPVVSIDYYPIGVVSGSDNV